MGLKEISSRLQSVVVVPVTPFDGRGAVDLEAYTRLVKRLIDGGIQVITPNGGTSEFYSLSLDEGERLLEAAASVARGKALVVPGVGLDVQTAIASARRAQQLGADAVMIHQPVHPQRSEEGWIAYHRAIASALPDLGLVLYIRDASIQGETIRQLTARVPNIVAIKYGVANPVQFAQVVDVVGQGRLTWLCGLSELWAPFFWISGARGFTSGLANVQPELSLEMLGKLQSEDYHGAMSVWQRVAPLEALRARHTDGNNVPVLKEALALLGICGRHVRPPLSELVESEREELRKILTGWPISTGAGVLGDA